MIREARVTKVKENAELAFYAADAGFNRARARLVSKQDPSGLNGTWETLLDSAGRPVGRYDLLVVNLGNDDYEITSTGTYGTGRYSTTRIVTGRIWVPTGGKKPSYWIVRVAHSP